MTELYLPLKHTHLMMVAVSVLFFLVRGVSSLLNAGWLQQKWAKISPHVIDTLLLGTGVMLTFAVHQYPIVDHWLTAKMVLLVGYIIFGVKMMKARVMKRKLMFFALALVSVGLLISVARTHHPLGILNSLI